MTRTSFWFAARFTVGVRADGVYEAVYDRGYVALVIENLAVNVSVTISIENLAENPTDETVCQVIFRE